jgi:hypothetical protein
MLLGGQLLVGCVGQHTVLLLLLLLLLGWELQLQGWLQEGRGRDVTGCGSCGGSSHTACGMHDNKHTHKAGRARAQFSAPARFHDPQLCNHLPRNNTQGVSPFPGLWRVGMACCLYSI